MKTVKLYFLALLFGAAIIISGCEDDNDPVGPGPTTTASGSITLNGGGYDNITMNITSGGAFYDASEGETGIALYGLADGDTARFLINFTGNTTGTYPWSDTSSYVSFYKNISTIYLSTDGSTTITNYGTVGNFIDGSFSGTIALFSAADSISVSGNFKARRSADN